jgi:hypothetical protein
VSTVDIEKLNLTVSFHAGAARASHGFTEKSRRPVLGIFNPLPLFRESGNRFATHVREVDVREIN